MKVCFVSIVKSSSIVNHFSLSFINGESCRTNRNEGGSRMIYIQHREDSTGNEGSAARPEHDDRGRKSDWHDVVYQLQHGQI